MEKETDQGNETESQKTQNERRKEIIHGESSREREREREKSVRISNKQLCIISTTATINNTTPVSNNVISRAILPQALVDFAGPKCRNLCHDYERNNPVQHQMKSKRRFIF